MTLDIWAILDIILPVMLFQPLIERFLLHNIGTVQTAPVTVSAVQICCRAFKVFPELNELLVLKKADNVAAVLHAVPEIFSRSVTDSESETVPQKSL